MSDNTSHPKSRKRRSGGKSRAPQADGPRNDPAPVDLIATTEALTAFCAEIADQRYITVDTEFMREKTYWPEVCLIQVAGGEVYAAIDPLADGMDLAPLWALFDNPDILKVFHAARQDLEIFYHLTGRLPAPVFDTQVAAMVCGFGDSVGYETLVNKLARCQIDKGPRFTDWSLRPLSDRQIVYALSDVTHLQVIFEKLEARLGQSGREGWLKAEMEVLTSPTTYAQPPEEAYLRLKSKSANRRFLGILREVAAWREREAQRRNLPRNRVLRDEAIVEIAHHAPRSAADLARTRGLSEKAAEGAFGDAILAAIAKGQALTEAELPDASERIELPRGTAPVADLLKVVLKLCCEEADVAQKLVCSAAEVEQIAAFGEKADVPALKGWRRELFGETALRVRSGQVLLGLDRNRIVLRDA